MLELILAAATLVAIVISFLDWATGLFDLTAPSQEPRDMNNFDPTAIVQFAFAFAAAVLASLGGLIVWLVKTQNAERQKAAKEAEASRQAAAAAQERIHDGYQTSMKAMAEAVEGVTTVVQAVQIELKEVRRQAKCHAPKQPRKRSAKDAPSTTGA